MLLAEGEKVLVIFRRLFDRDMRQHFVGVVQSTTPLAARATGFTFIYDVDSGKFIRKANATTRIFPLGDSQVLVSLLPAEVDINRVIYQTDAQRNLVITDLQGFTQSMTEFTGRYDSLR